MASRRDPWFRQLAERPTFLASEDLTISASWRIDKLLPWRTGLALPLTVTHEAIRADPEFLSRSDLRGDAIDDLRAPRSGLTTVSLSARRMTPLQDVWYAPLLNNLGLTATWNGTEARTAYQRGQTNGLDLGVDYLFADPDPLAPGATGALLPTMVRVISNVTRASGFADAFVRPTLTGEDVARRTNADERTWRSSSSVELRPLPALTARLDARSLRDLRDYGTISPNAIAAGAERDTWAGIDVGLERERVLATSILYSPVATAWLRPRIELASGYSLLRDPNAPGVRGVDDGIRLARRFGNSQRVLLSALVDLPLATGAAQGTALVHYIARLVGPVDVSVGRDQLSSYDAAPFTPGWRYQFGVGEFDDYRTIGDEQAASAGAGTRYTASNTFSLPLGATLAHRVQHTQSRHFSRRVGNELTLVDGQQRVYPDVAFRWTGQPVALTPLITRASASLRAVHTHQSFQSPPDTPGADAEVRATRIRAYPATLSLFGPDDGLSLTLGWSRSDRVDSLPGSVGESRSNEASANITRAFPLPASWNLPSGLRTQLSYTRNETRSYVSNAAASTRRSRLTDNGRTSFSLNADTDLAENMTFSLQASRVVTFDRNFNRRFTQTLLSAVLNIQFFGGAL
jgi:hypothetical protein